MHDMESCTIYFIRAERMSDVLGVHETLASNCWRHHAKEDKVSQPTVVVHPIN